MDTVLAKVSVKAPQNQTVGQKGNVILVDVAIYKSLCCAQGSLNALLRAAIRF